MPSRCADREPQRAAAGDADLSDLAAGQPEEVVGVVGGTAGGGDKALVAAVTIGVDRPAGDQPVGTDPVRGVVQRQVGDLTAGEDDANVPLAGLPGGVQLGVGQQLVVGVVAVEVASNPGELARPPRQVGRAIETGPRSWCLGTSGLVTCGTWGLVVVGVAGSAAIGAAACGAGLGLSVDRAAQLPSVTAVNMAAAASAWRGRMTIAPFPCLLRRSYQRHQGASSHRHNGAASPERLLGVNPVTTDGSYRRLGLGVRRHRGVTRHGSSL